MGKMGSTRDQVLTIAERFRQYADEAQTGHYKTLLNCTADELETLARSMDSGRGTDAVRDGSSLALG